MREVIFTLKTITPLFIAGANYQLINIPEKHQRDKYQQVATQGWDIQAEIRPPSFRGLMRYWLRTAVNGLSDITTVDLEDIVQFEQSIFGTTDHGSAVQMRIADISMKARRFKKEGFSQATTTGKDYLLWSMAESGKAWNYKPNRCYFPEGTQFKMVLSERITDHGLPSALPHAITSLWLLTHLGGIGSRSHRCAGSLAVQDIKGNTTDLSFTDAANREDLQEILQQGIQKIRTLSTDHLQVLKKHAESAPSTSAPFDRLLLPSKGSYSSLPHSCRIWILTQKGTGKSWQSLDDAIKTIGAELQKYRASLVLLDRATFGLPLIIRAQLSDKALQDALKDNRRSSPLSLRITKLGNNGYVGIAVLFKTPIPPILSSGKEKRLLIPAPDYTLIENWVATAFPEALEVTL